MLINVAIAQNKSTSEEIQNSIADTAVINAYVKLAFASGNPDTMTKYISRAREMSKSIGYKEGEVNCILAETLVYFAQGNVGQSIQQAKNALRHFEEMHNYPELPVLVYYCRAAIGVVRRNIIAHFYMHITASP